MSSSATTSLVEPSDPIRRPWDWWRDRIIYLAGFAFLAIMAVEFKQHLADADSPRCFLIAGRHMLAGEAIHRPTETYSYPPASAFLMLPLCRLPQGPMLGIWYALNAVAMAVLFRSAWQLAGGPAFVGMSTRWHGVFWLGAVLLAGRFLLAPLENLQTDLMMAALVTCGCCRIWERHELSGGLLIGTAAAMKCTPLLFIPYLLLRRNWIGAGALVAAAIFWNFIPDLVFPQTSGHSYLVDWAGTYLSFAGKSAPGVWHSDLLLNQSLGGALNRWIRLGLGVPVLDAHLSGRELPLVAVTWLKRATYGGGLLLLAITAIRGGKWFQRLPTRTVKPGPEAAWGQLQFGVEVSSIVCLMLLLSPMSGKAHFAILLPVCLLVARRVIEQPRGVDLSLLAVLVVCGPLSSKSLVGAAAGQLGLIWGTPTLFCLGSLICLWRMLRAIRSATSTESIPVISEHQSLPRAAAA